MMEENEFIGQEQESDTADAAENENAETTGEAKEEESKHDKFRRLASNRTNKILSTLTLLGNCSSRGTYEYSEEEIEKIFDTIQSKLDETKARFSHKKHEEDKFVL